MFFDQAFLVVIHIDSGGNVHGRDEAEAIGNPAPADDGFHLRSQVNHLVPLFRVQGQVLGMRLHLRHLRGSCIDFTGFRLYIEVWSTICCKPHR